MSVLVDIVNAVVDVTDFLDKTVNEYFYTKLTEFTAWFIKWSVVAMWKAKLQLLAFSWDVAQELLTSLNISSYIDQAWALVNAGTMNLISYFKIPEAINIILSARVTKFVFNFLGF